MENNDVMQLRISTQHINDLIHIIRGQQVMLDSDLAKLYGYEVKAFNQQVKRNKKRFPDDFMFQLTEAEVIELSRSQFVTSIQTEGIKGGRSYKPFVFTEQGIYMLTSVLKSEIAISQSIFIIRKFKEMRHYLAENKTLLNNTDLLKLSNTVMEHEQRMTNIENDMVTKKAVAKMMDKFINDDNIKEVVILDGHRFEALEAYISIYKKAKHSIYIIDDYVDINTLSMLKKKKSNIETILFTDNKGNRNTRLQQREVELFNEEYPTLLLKRNNGKCHDRFIILDYGYDTEKMYHCGASSKDAGKKVCCINRLSVLEIMNGLIEELLFNEEYHL